MPVARSALRLLVRQLIEKSTPVMIAGKITAGAP
jgi:hypothetical protein